MSCWRVLELSEQADGEQIPQLLIKLVFRTDSYTVHLTDLSNIWSEELDPDDIVDRASQEQSPIEVSKQDTAQLAILLDNVRKPLEHSDDATCRITRNDTDGITLHTSIRLPEPLDRLTWKFHLEKRASATLKNELILPLLVSSHIQHERITALVSTIVDKDKAITRLVDQYESNNLDLAAAFPSIGGLKGGRKMVKREQAAMRVPALQPFREEAWRQETGQLKDSDVTTLCLFQEALAQSTPKVPPKLKSEHRANAWWTAVPTRLSLPTAATKSKAKKPTPVANPKKVVVESSEDETEDEFETHENFKATLQIRNIPGKPAKTTISVSLPNQTKIKDEDYDESTDDEDPAPPKSQSQSQVRTPRKSPPRRQYPTLEPSPPPKVTSSPAEKSNVKGFRIGGKAKKATKSPEPLPEAAVATPDPEVLPTRESMPPSSQPDTQANMTPRKVRKPFKIGGKGKTANGDASQHGITASPNTNRMRATQSPTAEPPLSPPPRKPVKELTPVTEVHEETPEEKAERKRAELKRKNEEAAKKQAQAKKKKRF
ncbi:XLF-domain-containing protein [Clathrospora elynae]|uniref:Non-homologous end-joining factor 1 n=1 Tax=Clathrospora elynae TaxID=706981 RepID=A0A6A5SEB8_9PLEO|nr:XLF-domain-containing protein [Clathrospora elynae]